MESKDFDILAGDIESEEMIDSRGEKIIAADVLPVLEFLWERGVNLRDAVEKEDIIFLDEN